MASFFSAVVYIRQLLPYGKSGSGDVGPNGLRSLGNSGYGPGGNGSGNGSGRRMKGQQRQH